MREADVERLAKPYAPTPPRAVDLRLAHALEVQVPQAAVLRDEIFRDLDVVAGGIGWWAPSLGPARRRLIADYLFQAAWSIQFNLIQAGIHFLEAEGWREKEAESLKRAFVWKEGQLRSDFPTAKSPAEDLPTPMVELHTAGFVRALASALDCLAAVIVGVVALPTSILQSDIGTARTALQKLPAEGHAGCQEQRSFREQFEKRISDAGPSGWMEWTNRYRRMVVHRALRLYPYMLTPKAHVYDALGNPILHTEVTRFLPRDPAWSEVDAWRDPQRPHVLEEQSTSVLTGVKRSAVSLIDQTSGDLLALWRRRRTSPALLVQPEKQWSDPRQPPAGVFTGYAPTPGIYDPSGIVSDHVLHMRLRAASAFDNQRGSWATFSDLPTGRVAEKSGEE